MVLDVFVLMGRILLIILMGIDYDFLGVNRELSDLVAISFLSGFVSRTDWIGLGLRMLGTGGDYGS